MAWLHEWSAFFVLLFLGWILRRLIAAVYRFVVRRVDANVPDDMPLSAGAWAVEQVQRRKIDVEVLAGPAGSTEVDAFDPRARAVILSRDVYAKQDASFWAIAAHALVLVDEALASTVGLALLLRDGRVGGRAMVGAVTALVAAFMTYVGGFVGQLVLIEQRGFVIDQIERHRHFEPGPPLGDLAFVATMLGGFFLVVFAARAIVAVLRPRDLATDDEVAKHRRRALVSELGRGVLAIAIVWLVWDLPHRPLLPHVCVAGLYGSRLALRLVEGLARHVVSVVAAVVGVAAFVFWLVVAAIALRGRTRPKPAAPAPAPPVGDLTYANVGLSPLDAGVGRLETMAIDRYNRPPWYERVGALASPAVHVAFVVGIYVELFVH